MTRWLIFIIFCLLMAWPRTGHTNQLLTNRNAQQVDFEKLADAIKKAEGNENYGILAHYRHTSYRQACINTCKHKYRQWASNSKIKVSYMEYLASQYAPVGASNDLHNLNRNWLSNVRYFYER